MEGDARGILDPAAGLTRFRLDRHAPSERVARFVDRYWLASWNLTGREPYTQRVLAHPVVNLVFTGGTATVHGPTTEVTERRLEGEGWALGVMFRPAGFRPFLGRPMNTIVDAALPASEAFGALCASETLGGSGVLGAHGRSDRDGDGGAGGVLDADAVPGANAALGRGGAPGAGAVLGGGGALDGAVTSGPLALMARVDRAVAELLPVERHPAEDTRDVVERVAADPSVVNVSGLARREGMGVRLLQRRFADHVGLGPKAVIRRYRLYEAAERAGKGAPPDWGSLAAELGFSDQSHLTREFTAVLGTPPARYAARATPGG
ncbi:helix-turn-helix domain-containing protein [Nocardiopsis sp. HUAS JQ3]|uniref:helix-turn-helix domain-containing protein n=1 Tax=Nocardiopsis sp. HUAS JQ3 TaxID=3061629 RepID=UPI0023A948FC|nr:helix-turn-helix domain-containing protein [Nocardiopsis sp. HUAS JQ3]WDZ94071.1 helix-turn-helix domain-containing protein [Nocardiopsis sp. HUAS JQ3]